MSKLLDMRNKAREKLGMAALEDKKGKEGEGGDEEEKQLVLYLEMARAMFIAHRLNGSFEVSRTFAAVSRTVGLDVEGADEAGDDGSAGELVQGLSTDDSGADSDAAVAAATTAAASADVPEEKKMSTITKLVKATMQRQLKSLMKRSQHYKDKPYMSSLELSTEAGVSGPMLGLLSFSISFSATVEALNTAYEHTIANASK